MYNSIKIANFFLKSGQDSGIEITPMKLIKLVYIAHGWHLGFTGLPLLNDTVYAWKYGPVIDTLYENFKYYGNQPIKSLYTPNPFDDNPPLPDAEAEPLLKAVWNVYGKFDGIQLSAMTHQSGTPWDRVWNKEGGKDKRHVPIPNNYIEEHYKQKITENNNKAKEAAPAVLA